MTVEFTNLTALVSRMQGRGVRDSRLELEVEGSPGPPKQIKSWHSTHENKKTNSYDYTDTVGILVGLWSLWKEVWF